MAWSSSGGRKWIVSSEWTEINSVFVSRHRNRLDIRVGIEIDLISVMGSKSSCFLCGGSSLTWFQFRDRNWLGFSWGWLGLLCEWSKLIWFQCGGSKSAWFQIRHEIDGLLCGWSKLSWFQCGGSELTRFQCRDRKWRGLRAAVENELFQVNELQLTRFLCRGIEIDSILEWASKLTWFQWWGRNHLVFYVGDRAWLDFSLGIGIDSVFHEGRKWLGFSVWKEVNLAFVSRHQDWLEFRVGIETDLIIFLCERENFTRCLCGWSKLTWFRCGASNLS